MKLNNDEITYLTGLVMEEIQAAQSVLEEDPTDKDEQESLAKARNALTKLVDMWDPR